MIGCVTAAVGKMDVWVFDDGNTPMTPVRPILNSEILNSEIVALNNNPGKNDPLKKLFEKKGFTVDWDRDRDVGAWHEVYIGDEMVLQVKQGISIARFTKWLRKAPKADADFFVASDPDGLTKFKRKFNE